MERIQEALEKARKERQGNIGKADDNVDSQSISGDESGLAQQRPVAGSGLSSIEYTQTRQVKLSDAELKERRVIGGFQHDERAEVYRQLRSQVIQKLRSNNWNTLAITSANNGNGKSLTAINLAISLSQEVNQTVLLVDLDLASPDINTMLGLNTERGVVEYLRGEVELSEVLVNPGYERLVVLPSLPMGSHSSEVLTSPAMKTLLDELTSRYESRIIIFDLPPLLRNDDALVFTPQVDTTLLVVEDGVTTPDDVKRCQQLLEGSDLLGTVLNKAH